MLLHAAGQCKASSMAVGPVLTPNTTVYTSAVGRGRVPRPGVIVIQERKTRGRLQQSMGTGDWRVQWAWRPATVVPGILNKATVFFDRLMPRPMQRMIVGKVIAG
jgi:hypothetical protein